MMNRVSTLAIPFIIIPLILLLSGNCGIIALPIQGPKVVIQNAKTLDFTVDIVDPAGNPLDNVTATATRYSLRVDPVWFTLGEENTDPPSTINKTFTFKSFGKYAVAVEFAKPGYHPQKILYILKDDQYVPPSGFYISRLPLKFDGRVNITTYPHSQVTLTPITDETPSTQPASTRPSI